MAALVKSGKGQTPEAFQTRAEITKLERQINQVRLAQPLTKDGAINMPAVSREALATDAAPGSPTAPPTAPPVSLAGGIEVTDPGTKEINLPTDPTAEEDKPFVRDEAAARRIETDRLRAVQTGMQGDREAALAGLARSGDRGRQLATQIGNEEFTRRPNELKAIQTNEIHTDPETRQQYVLARQRDGSIARQNLGTVAKEDPDNRRKNDEMFMKTNTLHAEAGQRLALTNQGMSTVDDALNMAREFNAYGGVLSTAYSAIARAVGNDAANRYKTMMGSVLLDNLKAAFGANPTEGERAALADLTSNVSNGRVATEELLTRMRRLLAERQARTRLEIADLDLVKERYRPKASTSAKPNETSAPYGGRWENKQ